MAWLGKSDSLSHAFFPFIVKRLKLNVTVHV